MPIIISGTAGKTVISASGQMFAEGASQLPSSNKGTGDIVHIGNNDGNMIAGMVYMLSGVHNAEAPTWVTASAATNVASTGLPTAPRPDGLLALAPRARCPETSRTP